MAQRRARFPPRGVTSLPPLRSVPAGRGNPAACAGRSLFPQRAAVMAEPRVRARGPGGPGMGGPGRPGRPRGVWGGWGGGSGGSQRRGVVCGAPGYPVGLREPGAARPRGASEGAWGPPGPPGDPLPLLPVPQVLVIDGRGHLLGRLAAIVAKQVLLGECGTPPPRDTGTLRGHRHPWRGDEPLRLLSLTTVRAASCTTS